MGLLKYKAINQRPTIRRRSNPSKAYLEVVYDITVDGDMFNVTNVKEAIGAFELVEIPERIIPDSLRPSSDSDNLANDNDDDDDTIIYKLKKLQTTYREQPTEKEFLAVACQKIKFNIKQCLVKRVFSAWPTISVPLLEKSLDVICDSTPVMPTAFAHQVVRSIVNNIEEAYWQGASISKEAAYEILLATAVKIRRGLSDELHHVIVKGTFI